MKVFRHIAVLVVALSVLLLGGHGRAGAQATASPGSGVLANLWEWNWPSVGQECKTVLGPDGYAGVQVSSPADSYASPGHEWWDVYQPAGYDLTSRFGTEAQFRDMVTTCRAAGVKVYVDAVINHMTSDATGTSYGGYQFTKYSYSNVYRFDDFHHYPADCPQPDGQIHDYSNYQEVTKCELLGLADLRTEDDYVRNIIASYLNQLIDAGVSGFRVDAAKHIGQTDLAAIESRLHPTLDGTPPYMALEVQPGSPGQLAPEAFEPVGSLLGFDYATSLTDAFDTRITKLKNVNKGVLPSDKELVFVENHDTERGTPQTLSYKSGKMNLLATEFMLAWPHGTPEVYASFAWDNTNQPPPSDGRGFVTDTNCSKGWVCNDRTRGVVGMVAFHNAVGDAPVAHWSGYKGNLIAFSRGTAGWIALNNNRKKTLTRTFTTGLPKGTYCDLIHARYSGGSCTGTKVKVDTHGKVKVTVKAEEAVAIDSKAKVS